MLDCYAITIDDVRDIFRADEQLSAELTQVVAEALPKDEPKKSAFWPLMRKTPYRIDPKKPTTEDLDTLLSGGFIAPQRMAPSWQLFLILLDHQAKQHIQVELRSDQLDSIEFDLCRHGLDSFYSIRRLGERPLGIPLRAPTGKISGYAKRVHVSETATALEAVLDQVKSKTRESIEPIRDLCAKAAADGLDVVLLES